MPMPKSGETRSKYIARCVRVVVAEGKDQKQAVAKCHGMWRQHHKRKPTVNIRKGALKYDPSRTTMIVRKYIAEMRARFRVFTKAVVDLVAREDAFGLKHMVVMTRWMPLSNDKKLEEFREWLATQEPTITGTPDNIWMGKYIEEAYRKGATRTFDEVRHPELAERMDFYAGTRGEFLRSAFGAPAAIEKVNLLAMRNYTDLRGVTDAMSNQMARALADGMAIGLSPHEVARQMSKTIAGIERTRAEVIARTETIRAHAEGQLDAMKRLGVEEVGVMVEWSTTGDDRVCSQCADMEGVVLKVDEAHNLIPRHPNCRCVFIPANVGEDRSGQKRSKADIEAAFKKSVLDEVPKNIKGGGERTEQERLDKSRWQGADKTVDKNRPKDVFEMGKTSTTPRPPRAPRPPKIVEPTPKPAEISWKDRLVNPTPRKYSTESRRYVDKKTTTASKERAKAIAKWKKSLTRYEREMLNAFTGGGGKHHSQWGWQSLKRAREAQFSGEMNIDLERWNAVFKRSPGYDGEIYRGIRLSDLDNPKPGMPTRAQFESNMKVGNVIDLKYDASFSRASDVAADFSENNAYVFVTNSSKNVSIEHLAGGYEWQKEIVVQAGSKFSIASIEEVMIAGTDGYRFPVKLVHLTEVL